MEVNGELHVVVAFTPEADTPDRILQAAGWSLEEVWKPSKRKNLLPQFQIGAKLPYWFSIGEKFQ